MGRPNPRHPPSRGRGVRLRRTLNGRRFGKTSVAIAELAPDLEDMINDVLFGQVWSRPVLDLKTRSVAVISALTALQRLPQLKNYIGNALNAGMTREEIVEVLIQLVFYVGLPAVANAFEVAREVFEEEDNTQV